MLGPAGDVRLDVDLLQLAVQDVGEVGDQPLAVLPLPVHPADDVVVGVRVQVAEGQVLQLPPDLADAQPVRERRVDVHRLAGDAPAPGLRQRLQRPHVVEPVGELDEDHADVVRHRQEHPADVLRVQLLVGAELDPAELGDALDQAADRRAELGLDLLQRQLGVLDGVVEEGGAQGLRVQAQRGQDAGDVQRVLDVLLAGDPPLPHMDRRGARVGLLDQLPVCGSQVPGDPQKLRDAHDDPICSYQDIGGVTQGRRSIYFFLSRSGRTRPGGGPAARRPGRRRSPPRPGRRSAR